MLDRVAFLEQLPRGLGGRRELATSGTNPVHGRSFPHAEAEIASEIYHSENGDRWFLNRDDDGCPFILHNANLSSGGKVSAIEIGEFLSAGRAGSEHQALIRLICRLVESG
jgi:hypothetical protein